MPRRELGASAFSCRCPGMRLAPSAGQRRFENIPAKRPEAQATMRTSVTVLIVILGVVLAAVLSGQIIAPAGEARSRPVREAPEKPRTRAVHALDAVDRRVRAIDPLAHGGTDTRRIGEELLARASMVRDMVQKLDPDDAAQRGAWAGLRASIADLEYRTDLLVLMSRSNAVGFLEGAQPTIEETVASLDAIEASLGSQGRLDNGARLQALRRELDRIRAEAADDAAANRASIATREAWSRDLATLRRELRSIERSTEQLGEETARDR